MEMNKNVLLRSPSKGDSPGKKKASPGKKRASPAKVTAGGRGKKKQRRDPSQHRINDVFAANTLAKDNPATAAMNMTDRIGLVMANSKFARAVTSRPAVSVKPPTVAQAAEPELVEDAASREVVLPPHPVFDQFGFSEAREHLAAFLKSESTTEAVKATRIAEMLEALVVNRRVDEIVPTLRWLDRCCADVFEVDWREGWWRVIDEAMEERGLMKMDRSL